MKDKTENTTARRKLIPAVAMLTTSAVMLSSATYAWFTLNKEVEVTGLQMEAIAGDALEISLGKYSDEITSIAAPERLDPGWKRSIKFGDYYKELSALKPASSDTGLKIIAVEESKVGGGGATVADDAKVYIVGEQSESLAKYNKVVQTKLSGDADTTPYSEDDAGYYLDIPMWIRTNKKMENASDTVNVDCTVSITDVKDSKKSGDLKNAVRVAIIPVKEGSKYDEFTTGVPAVSDTTATSTVFGLTKGTLNGGVLPATATGTETYGSVAKNDNPNILQAASTLRKALIDGDDTDTDDANNTPAAVTFQLPSASDNDYSGCAFIIRVWLEGESKYCLDTTANQDWRLDFHFELCNHANDSAHASTASPEKQP